MNQFLSLGTLIPTARSSKCRSCLPENFIKQLASSSDEEDTNNNIKSSRTRKRRINCNSNNTDFEATLENLDGVEIVKLGLDSVELDTEESSKPKKKRRTQRRTENGKHTTQKSTKAK